MANVISANSYLSIATSYARAKDANASAKSYLFDALYRVVLLEDIIPAKDLLIPFHDSYQINTEFLTSPTGLLSAVRTLNRHVLNRSQYSTLDAYFDAEGLIVPQSWADLSASVGFNISEEYIDPGYVAQGDRVFSIDIKTSENGSYDDAFAIAQGLEAGAVSLSFGWDDIEDNSGSGSVSGTFTDTDSNFAIANFYYPLNNMPISLSLTPIDTNVDRRPTDLQGDAWNSSDCVTRFKAVLDFIAGILVNPDLEISSISIGNEIDRTLGENATEWAEWTDFFDQISDYARTLWPGVPIGCKATHKAFFSETQSVWLQDTNAFADVIMITYYAVDELFFAKPISAVEEEIALALEDYQGRIFHFAEIGYPSSVTCNSSELLQSQFVEAAFRAWDTHKDQIKVMNFLWLHDASSTQVDEWEIYYGSSDPVFLAFLSSLGFRYWAGNGTDKLAFTTIERELMERNWVA